MDKTTIGTCAKCSGPVIIAGPHAYQCDQCGAEYGRDVVGEYGVIVGERKPKKLAFVKRNKPDLTADGIVMSCDTSIGTYYIHKFDSGFCVARDCELVEYGLNTSKAAIAAAWADYECRVMECFE